MRDGITLAADITLPAALPAPAVVMRTPYGRSGRVQEQRGDEMAAGGYAQLTVDVRGRGDSDGTFVPYRNDGPDGVDVIAWVAAQPWCTGDVATYGGSYPGMIQYLTALHRPAALRAMVVMVTPSDPFVEEGTGVPSPMNVSWFRLVDGRAPQYVDGVDWMEVYRHRPLLTMDEAAGFVSANWREELRHRTLDAFWEPRRYQHRIGEIDVPVLHVSGWYDDEEIGTPLNYAAMVGAGRTGQHLLVGPWGHRVNATRTLGDVDFGPDALIDLNAHVLRFLDHHLRSGPPPGPTPVRLFVMGANRWIDEEEWPPASTRETVLFLHGEGRANSRYGDGTLSAEPPGEEPADRWVHDPGSPVPFVTAPSSAQIGGPDDCAGIQGRSDVLVYSGAPLAGTWSPRSGGCSPRTRSGTARAGPRASSSGRGRPRIPEPGPQGLAASGVPAAPAGGRAASQAQTPIRAAAMASPSTHTPVHPHPAYTPPAAAEPAAPPTKYEVM